MHPASTDEQQPGRKRRHAYGQLGDGPLHNGRHSRRKASITSPPSRSRTVNRPGRSGGRRLAHHIRDIRRQALHIGGYAVRCAYSEREKRWKVFVRLDRETYGNLRAHMFVVAIRTSHRSPEVLEQEFRQLRGNPKNSSAAN